MVYLIITFRVITIMLLFLTMTLITGRKKMGEIPVFDFLVFVSLAAVVGADIADPDIKHLPTAYAIVLITALQYLYGIVIIRNRKIGKLLTFEPVVIIEKGQLVKGNLKKLKYSLDTVLMMLREKDVFDLNEVDFAIIEATGQMSVLKKAEALPPSAKKMKMETADKGLCIPLIVEGKIYEDNLRNLSLDMDWLMFQLKKRRVFSEKNVFYAAVNDRGSFYVSKGLDSASDRNHIRH